MTASRSPGRPKSLAGADWLVRPATRAVFAALAAGGHAARVVGGVVRNTLLGRAVTDIDIATTALPEQVIAAAKAAGLVAVPTGMAHGTVTVIAGHVPYEVTTLRRDVETHGRHATVAFTDDWAADAGRRDFTINALYCDAEGEVFDPLGGLPDIEARRVRFIGEAAERIREDYLRILRFFRFTAEYAEGSPDAAGLSACVQERAGLARLSAERVRQEMLRLLVAPRAVELVEAMQDYGLLPSVLGSAPRPALLRRLAAIETALAQPADAIMRLAALVVEVPEDAGRLTKRLRLSNDEHDRLAQVAHRSPDIGPAAAEPAARAFLYSRGPQAYRDRMLLAWARSGAAPDSEAWRTRLALPARWQPPRLAVGGADVMALGVPAGPRVGEVLRALEAWWIAGDFAADEAAVRKELERLAARLPTSS